MEIKTLIVDDEPLARERIRSLLAGDDEIAVIGECGDGASAASAILERDPDLVFLDVQMPALDGFAALELVGGARAPVIVFVTAYDEYALKAFQVHALDYLLKPFDRARFIEALERAKRRVRGDRRDQADHGIERLLDELREARGREHLERLVVKTGGRVFFVPVDEIERLEAAGNYVQLHTGADVHLIRSTLKALEERLDPRHFIRVHRSVIVNIRSIREIQPWFNGDFVILLHSGAEVTSGASYREALKRLMAGPGHP